MGRTRTWLAAGPLTLALLGAGAHAPAREPAPDVRIVVDVSGSMKRSDPRNLRRSALALVVRLLPEGSRAGVWTFGQYVNMQVPLGQVSAAWRATAEDGARAIHSRGLFTNIEDALARATWDWTSPAPDARRHLILLTDGVIDVPEGAGASAASRARVLEERLPSLAAAGARVHTIALSDEADHALLRTLAAETDGAHARAGSADALQRVFLHMFERAAPPDALPLTDNAFVVDEGVREMTLLVFRAPEAPPTRLQTPAGDSLEAASTLDALTWRTEPGYDLITMQAPEPGEWRIEAAEDADNRVLVVTDLRLGWEPIANNVLPGAQVTISAGLTERGEPVTREDFLRLVEAELVHWPGGSEPMRVEAVRPAGDPRFAATLPGPLGEGPHELVLTVDGGTFSRQLRHVFEVAQPVVVTTRPTGTEAAPTYALTVSAQPALLDPATLTVEATLTAPTGERVALAVADAPDGSVSIAAGPLGASGKHQLDLRISGRTPGGREIAVDLPAGKLDGAAPAAVVPEPVAAAQPQTEADPPGPTGDAAPARADATAPAPDALVAVDEADPPNWLITAAVVLAANLAAGLGVWGALRWLRRRASSPAGALNGGAEPAEDADPEPAADPEVPQAA